MRNLDHNENRNIVFMVNSPSDYGLDYFNHLTVLERLSVDYRCCVHDAIYNIINDQLMVNYQTLIETINYSNVDYAYDILVGETCADVTPDLEYKLAQDYQKGIYAYQEIVWLYYQEFWNFFEQYRHVKEYADEITIEAVGNNTYVNISFTEIIGTYHKRNTYRRHF